MFLVKCRFVVVDVVNICCCLQSLQDDPPFQQQQQLPTYTDSNTVAADTFSQQQLQVLKGRARWKQS